MDLGLTPGSYEWEWTGDTATVVVVPESSSIFLLGFASLGILARRKRTI
ncbi:MAG: PEP-CTERM sorting domain-containing protein [Akkermansiaceae bacterium]